MEYHLTYNEWIWPRTKMLIQGFTYDLYADDPLISCREAGAFCFSGPIAKNHKRCCQIPIQKLFCSDFPLHTGGRRTWLFLRNIRIKTGPNIPLWGNILPGNDIVSTSDVWTLLLRQSTKTHIEYVGRCFQQNRIARISIMLEERWLLIKHNSCSCLDANVPDVSRVSSL